MGVLAHLSDRPLREALSAFGAVLVVQLILGMGNDVADAAADRRAKTSGKPIAEDLIPAGNVTFAMVALFLVAIPLSLQNGRVAALALLATVLVGYVHNKWLHRGLFSWVGWTATFGLLPAFLAYGGWAGGMHGTPPTFGFTAASAALGFCLHFATTLPDLVADHAAGLRNLPLRVALRTGAPRLLLLTVVATLLATGGLVAAGLTVGLRQ